MEKPVPPPQFSHLFSEEYHTKLQEWMTEVTGGKSRTVHGTFLLGPKSVVLNLPIATTL